MKWYLKYKNYNTFKNNNDNNYLPHNIFKNPNEEHIYLAHLSNRFSGLSNRMKEKNQDLAALFKNFIPV